jgi:hypothetical protein
LVLALAVLPFAAASGEEIKAISAAPAGGERVATTSTRMAHNNAGKKHGGFKRLGATQKNAAPEQAPLAIKPIR